MWLFIILLVVGVALAILAHVLRHTGHDIVFIVLSTAVLFILVVCIAGLLVTYCGLEGDIVANETRYESLVYQAENHLYDNDNDVGKKELMNQIQEWNEDVSTGKAMMNNPWIGWFYPSKLFENLELIPLDIIQ